MANEITAKSLAEIAMTAMSEDDAAKLAHTKIDRMGTWPDDCLQRAFVDGASWWQFESQGSTMFPSERDQAEAEALNRYGLPSETTRDKYEQALLVSGNHLASALLAIGLISGLHLNDYRHMSYEMVLENHGQPFTDIWVGWLAIINWRDATNRFAWFAEFMAG